MQWAASFSKPFVALHESWGHLRRTLRSIHESQAQSTAETIADSVAAWDRLVHQSLSAARVPHMIQSDVMAALNTCIRAGMAVFFPAYVGLDLPAITSNILSDTSVKLLKAAAKGLKSCIRQHERQLLFIYGKVHYMPAMSVYARAVLHWFQWVLHSGGHSDEPP
eukprot:scaffold609357_cov33-Prasinocladus_malaysianus.AAC.1